MKNCEVSVFPLSSRAPSSARKQYCQLIRHRKETLGYSFLISSSIKRRFISISLLLLCLFSVSVPIVQEKENGNNLSDKEQICKRYGTHLHLVPQRVLRKARCRHVLQQFLSAASLFHSPPKVNYFRDSQGAQGTQLHFREV